MDVRPVSSSAQQQYIGIPKARQLAQWMVVLGSGFGTGLVACHGKRERASQVSEDQLKITTGNISRSNWAPICPIMLEINLKNDHKVRRQILCKTIVRQTESISDTFMKANLVESGSEKQLFHLKDVMVCVVFCLFHQCSSDPRDHGMG